MTIHMVANLHFAVHSKAQGVRVITGDNSDEKTGIAECVTQLLATMVKKSLRYGFVGTGEAMIFLHIRDDDAFTVDYHVSYPSSDVNG